MRYCYICGKVDSSVSLHKFPSDKNSKNRWLQACTLSELDNVKNIRLCSRHFNNDDFIDLNARRHGGHITLKRNACPTLQMKASKKMNPKILPEGDDMVQHASTSTSQLTFTSQIIPFIPEVLQNNEITNNVLSDITAPSTPKIRWFIEPRYISEVGSPDVETPRRAKRVVRLAKSELLKKNKLIKSLQAKNRYLNKRVKCLKDVILRLKDKNLVSSNSSNK
ncbi:uncharacterized protein LOC116170464 isoform X1 [Photinus pyralis]|uniref:THAP-type domain-containing protein n=1 Tax=Photinus pyralis TaxID=7054 RepID=A0A1Y1LB22_PHOPY|nr:uncharacterized protein LOC116170464 isoform X1 [Photinus pyralis]XP_031342763.1 uncharacterized protein LOC116170464 isoform X1 [Photinus pyralis]